MSDRVQSRDAYVSKNLNMLCGICGVGLTQTNLDNIIYEKSLIHNSETNQIKY